MANSISENVHCPSDHDGHSHNDWKFWCIAAASLLAFGLLFQPWVSASGPRGEVSADAFGRINGERLRTWLSGSDGYLALSGTWGMFAAIAALSTVSAAVLYIGTRNNVWVLVMVVTSAVMAVCVCAALLYLRGKAPELRDMTTMPPSEFATGVRSVLHRFFGSGNPETQVATARLDVPGVVASLIAIGTTIAAMVTKFGQANTVSYRAQALDTHRPIPA